MNTTPLPTMAGGGGRARTRSYQTALNVFVTWGHVGHAGVSGRRSRGPQSRGTGRWVFRLPRSFFPPATLPAGEERRSPRGLSIKN